MSDSKVPMTMEEEYDKEGVRRDKWAVFIEATVAEFFNKYELEKMSLEDGNGNKAKFTRLKDESIKVEHSTTTIL